MLKLAVHNLIARPARSLLALLGLTVAIVGMVGLYSIAGGIDRLVEQTFIKIPGVTVIQSGAPIPLFSRIPADWESTIAELPEVNGVCPEVWGRANMIEGKMVLSPPRFLFGTDIAARNKLQRAVYRDEIVQGRFLNDSDRGTDNVVISRVIATEYHKKVGDTLRIDGRDMRIVGIYHCGSLLLDVAIVLDLERVREFIHLDREIVSSYYVEPRAGVGQQELIEKLRMALKGKPWLGTSERPDPLQFWSSGLVPGGMTLSGAISSLVSAFRRKASDVPHGRLFEVRGSEQWREGIDELSSDLDLFLLMMTSLGVTIALLSILNTMLMSVSERFVEFGILKANGWNGSDIVKLIVIESALLGFCGGILGSVIGWIGTHIVNAFFADRTELYASPALLLFGLLFSLLLGIVGGAYPAWRAAGMSPMEAIRRN